MPNAQEDNKDLTAEQIEALKVKAEATDKIIEELKEVRKSRAEDRAALDALLKDKKDEDDAEEAKPAIAVVDVKKTVESLLEAREKAKLSNVRVDVLNKFKNSKVEFNEANDPGGIKFKAYEKELSKFNLDNIQDAEVFQERYDDVYLYMKRKESRQDSNQNNIYAGTNQHSGAKDPQTTDTNTLSKPEMDLINKQGWSKERFLKLKAKQPTYVTSLLRHLN